MRKPFGNGITSAVTLAALATLASFASLASFGCSKLTEPPRPEPMQQSAVPTAEPKEAPAPSASAAPSAAPPAATAPAPSAAPSNPNAKLETKDLVVGKGPEAKTGDTVRVHYVGTLVNGTEPFDASRNHGNDGFTFQLGQGNVIKGWDDGVPGMKVGGKRKLTIPPNLGYGARGAGAKIPPNSTLVFEVELLEIKKK